jgi:hypothetical protein
MGQNQTKKKGASAPHHAATTRTTSSTTSGTGVSSTTSASSSKRRGSMLVAAEAQDPGAALSMLADANAGGALAETDECGRTALHIACMAEPGRRAGAHRSLAVANEERLRAGSGSHGPHGSAAAASVSSPLSPSSAPSSAAALHALGRHTVVDRSSRRIMSSPTFRLVLSLGGGQFGRGLIDMEDGSRSGARDGGGRTPLGHACLAGNVEALCALLTLGADIGKPDSEGMTPLHHAARGGNVSIAEILLGHAVDARTAAASVSMLKKSPSSSRSGRRRKHRSGSGTPTTADAKLAGEAASRPAHDATDAPLEILVNVDKLGRTPLHWAALHGHVPMVHLLMEHGAQVASRSEGGWAPAHRAALNNQAETVGALLDWGHRVDMRDERDESILEVGT